jgi:hypothetical protein
MDMKGRLFPYRGLVAAVLFAAGLMMTAPMKAQNYAAGTASASTPRTPDGKPDLSGTWNGRPPCATTPCHTIVEPGQKLENGDYSQRFESRRCGPTQKGTDGVGCFEETNETADLDFTNRYDANRPLYKPEYWDKVQDLDYNTNTKDPVFTCLPQGVPRMGPPAQIVQTAKYVVFVYVGQFRIIPIDGRGHDPVRAQDISYFGDPVGHWDGDTLVVESVGFTDSTWLKTGGFFHSYDMRVTERLKRDGNTIHYQATVEDPTVLLQPWVTNARDLQLNSDPKAYVQEGDQCFQVDPGIVVSRVRH